MPISKVLFNGKTVIDITDSTVTPDKLLQGEKAYDNKANGINGTFVPLDISDSTVTADTLLEGKKAYDKNGNPILGTMKQTIQQIVQGGKANDVIIDRAYTDKNNSFTWTFPTPLSGSRNVAFIAAFSNTTSSTTDSDYMAEYTRDSYISWASAIVVDGVFYRRAVRYSSSSRMSLARITNFSKTYLSGTLGGTSGYIHMWLGAFDSD